MRSITTIEPCNRVEPLLTLISLQQLIEDGILPNGKSIPPPSKMRLLKEVNKLIEHVEEHRTDKQQRLTLMTQLLQDLGKEGFFG